jgi:hypothetical protein
MKIDSKGRVYSVKYTNCIECNIELTYTHNKPLFCKDCYVKRFNKVHLKKYREENPEKVKSGKESYMAERPKNRRERLLKVAAIKLEAGCADCGYNQYACALDFDHVRGEKLFDLSRSKDKSWSLVSEEIAKCEVVCAICHRVRTFKRAGNEF